MPTPEELARINIDRQPIACGWIVLDMTQLNRYVNLDIIAKEFLDGET